MKEIDNQFLLNEYKKYDYLNKDKTNPLVKILVSYIKPSFLFKSEILTPIHLGKAVIKEKSKDGIISGEDLNWLEQNCEYNDDFDDGISKYNRRIGFLTGTYWAWKNYEKLGNPEYFGSFGYRRLLAPEFLSELEQYDAIIPYRVDFSKTGGAIKNHILKLQGSSMFNAIVSVLEKVYCEEKGSFNAYLEMKSAYMYEIYVMKKEIFFKFCEWIFPLLFEFLKIPHESLKFVNEESLEAQFINKVGEVRDIAYAMEILCGYFCFKLNNNKGLRILNSHILYLEDKLFNFKKNNIIADLLRGKLKK